MRQRVIQLIWAEFLALGSFVFGGLGVVGGLVTWAGESQHRPLVSWCLVVAFALLAAALGWVAAKRLRLVFWPGQKPGPKPGPKPDSKLGSKPRPPWSELTSSEALDLARCQRNQA